MNLSRRVLIGFFVILFGILIVNTFHEEYPDEFDSILGGKYIASGKLIYKHWFQHHQPGAYVLAAFIYPLSGTSFVRFRVILAIFWFLLHYISYRMVKTRLGRGDPVWYLGYIGVISVAATFYWGHMLLADSLASAFIAPAAAILIGKAFARERLNATDLAVVNVFLFLSWFTSLTYTFVVGVLTLYAIVDYWQGLKKKPDLKRVALVIVRAVALPYLVFLAYVLVTGSVSDYYFANVVYNQRYYIYNYPRPPGAPVNPVRYAVVIATDFLNNYIPSLMSIKDFNFANPVVTFLAAGSLSLIVLAMLRKRYLLAAAYFLAVMFANSRSNPMLVRETDYQAAVYIVLSTLAASFVLVRLVREIDTEKLRFSERVAMTALLLIVSTYSFFTTLHFFQKMLNTFYPKYMGTMPLIYDRPQVAPYVNAIAGRDGYAWIGPFEFEELYYMDAKVPTKYHWFLQHAATSKIKDEMIPEFQAHLPNVIVFNRVYAPWGGDPHEFNYFFTDFLDANYIRLYQYNEEHGTRYVWKERETLNFVLDRDINLLRSEIDAMLPRLLEQGLVRSE